jgi:hypothetical protein
VVVGLRDLPAKPFPVELCGKRVTPGMSIGKSYSTKMSILPINQENEKERRKHSTRRKQCNSIT